MGVDVRQNEKVEKVTEFAENEKSSEESWSSIEKSTRRDKETNK